MERRIVLPGELVAEGNYRLGDGVYREGNKIYSSLLGLLDEKKGFIRVIPFTRKYIPKAGDFVIGKIIDIQFASWEVDINSPYRAILNVEDFREDLKPGQVDLSKFLSIGDVIFAVVKEITPSRRIYLSMRMNNSTVLRRGRLVEVTPSKIPRVIGKKKSMLLMIKREIGIKILVGQNGRIWLDGTQDKINLAVKVLRKIEKEAHTSGLTDRVKEMIRRERDRK
ncbi:MAG: RNA-binding protein [Candidatus Hydrothermarchaeota archaeon]|nr:MAG: RNA-binding protein [Candidatus Hydrothermarchaeota archaeon]